MLSDVGWILVISYAFSWMPCRDHILLVPLDLVVTPILVTVACSWLYGDTDVLVCYLMVFGMALASNVVCACFWCHWTGY